MSVNYALGLSTYEFKGKCGMKEIVDPDKLNNENIIKLVELLKRSKHTVVITGAGISTAAGIPDFRGPKGVWTLEEQGLMPEVSINFETAKPTLSHMALVTLEAHGYIKHLISQNVDGLHLRSGFPRNRLSELHGNMFLEECDICRGQFLGMKTVPTMGLKYTGSPCTRNKTWGRCRGKLKDTILDWEDELPAAELKQSEDQSRLADLCLCLGTSLQIQPCGNMPILTKKRNGKVVIVSLQPTRHDKQADIKLHAYVDDVMKKVCDGLNIEIPEWSSPTFILKSKHADSISRSLRYIQADEGYMRSIVMKLTVPLRVSPVDELSDFQIVDEKAVKSLKYMNKNHSNCSSDGILDTIDTQFANEEISPDEMNCSKINLNKFNCKHSIIGDYKSSNITMTSNNISSDISLNDQSNHKSKRLKVDSKISKKDSKISKKEKSTDCDSALIPLLCVHG